MHKNVIFEKNDLWHEGSSREKNFTRPVQASEKILIKELYGRNKLERTPMS